MSTPAPMSLEAWPRPVPLEPGRMLDAKYRLERLLGQGGMGSVWRARNVLLDLAVALKIVHPEARGADASARLLTEARVEATLHHPNVVRVFDYGQSTHGEPYIVMELVDGKSLGEMLCQAGSLSPRLAVQLLLPVIDALCAAHGAGIIHRDLKPDNILVSVSGTQLRPKLVDFGIAKFESAATPRRLTRDGSVLGSPGYMAPEQARGDDVDSRVDVWGVCVVLYEAISGKPAFEAADHEALIAAVQQSEPEPLAAVECETLWPILRRGLAKDPANRIATMQQLGDELATWLVAQGAYEDASGTPLSRRWPVPGPNEPAAVTPELRAFAERVQRALGSAFALAPRALSAARTVRKSKRVKLPARARTGLFLAAGFGVGSWLFTWIQHLEDRTAAPPPAAASVLRPVHAEAKPAAPPPSAPAPAPATIARSPEPRGVSPWSDEVAKKAPPPPPKRAVPAVPAKRASELLRQSPPGPPAAAAPVRSTVRTTEADLGLKKPW